jgi:thiosulfate dehydrogenase
MNLFLRNACLLGCVWLGACSSSDEQSAVERGRELFQTKALSPSGLNDYSCATCHELQASDPPSKKAGAALAGVTRRTHFWGGQEADLLRSVNACRNYFMLASQPLAATDKDARALYAYLESLEPGDDSAQPFTVVTTIDPLPAGDASNGQVLYAQTCASCHGGMHSGTSRLSERVPILPEDTVAAHVGYSPRQLRLVFIEKIRHGLFLGYSGVMPPFSTQLLSDSDVSDLLEALEVFVPPE